MKIRILLFGLLVSLVAGVVGADLNGPDDLEAGLTALKDRDWKKAVTSLEKALASAKEGHDEILYHLATAHQHAKSYDAAIKALDRLVKDTPDSSLRRKAVFKKGDLLAAKREFALAAQIYDAQLGELTAQGRRKKIAMVYVDAGREYLNPKTPNDPTFTPDHKAAHTLLVKSLELDALGDAEEDVRRDIITCELKAKFNRQILLKSADDFLEKFPESEHRDEALFARATALRELGRVWEAKQTWHKLAADFPKSERAPEGLHYSALIHMDSNGNTSNVEELRRALPLLRRVAADFPTSQWGPTAAYQIGLALGRYEELHETARKELMAFVGAFPDHKNAPDALLQVAHLHRSDQKDDRAVSVFEDFLKRYPDNPRWIEVRTLIANVRFDVAQRAFVREDWPAARERALTFGTQHPTDGRAPAMAFRVGEVFLKEKKHTEAVAAWSRVAARYPNHNEGHHARYEAGRVLAEELGNFDGAFKELAKVRGAWHGQALQQIQTLRGPALTLKSEKVFVSTDTPSVRLTLRNVEKVTLRTWTLDLKDYFEKKASTTGLDALEVSIIAPDKEWEHEIKDYKKFEKREIDVELPKKDPGAYIVTARAGTLEAKTVVVVSDLSIIARSGRNAAIVLAQNRLTGARVEKPILRAAADGKHIKSWSEETLAGNVSFLAESDGHLAFRDINVARLPVPPKRSPRGLILTDRIRYAPEDTVRVQLFLRSVDGGQYVLPRGKKYRLTAFSAQNLPFFVTDVTPSAAGTAHADFALLRGLSGQFRIEIAEIASPRNKLVGSTTLSIASAAPQRKSFEMIVEEKVYFLGDDVDLTFVLRDARGRPMPDREVRVRISAQEWDEQRTRADGTFSVPLRNTNRYFRRNHATVTVVHEGHSETFTISLLSRGTFLSFEEESRIGEPVIAGTAKSVILSAAKADDSPVVGTFRYRVFRTNKAGERIAVTQGEVKTDEKGRGTISFTPKQGGIHTVAVTQFDADALPVSVMTAVSVYDDTDDRKLRLLSSSGEFESGKPMKFTAFSLLDEGTAFVTVESEKIEQVKTFRLGRGHTPIELGPPPAATGDFTVTVMMMQGNKFHADARNFRIKVPKLEVQPEKETVRPGRAAKSPFWFPSGSPPASTRRRSAPTGWVRTSSAIPRRRRHSTGPRSKSTRDSCRPWLGWTP